MKKTPKWLAKRALDELGASSSSAQDLIGGIAELCANLDLQRAYSGHVIIEAYRDGRWGAVDPPTRVIYRDDESRPVSAWDLVRDATLVERHFPGPDTHFMTREQFRGVAISNYFIWNPNGYEYSTSGVNAYYRAILDASERGWPGGLRWIHGEDVAG